MTPEMGTQPQDGVHVSSPDTGHARLHEGQGNKVAEELPLVKFQRIWAQENRGNSGTERLTGR